MSRTHDRVFVGCEVAPEIKQALQRELQRKQALGKPVSESDVVREALTRYLLSSSITAPVMDVKLSSEGEPQ